MRMMLFIFTLLLIFAISLLWVREAPTPEPTEWRIRSFLAQAKLPTPKPVSSELSQFGEVLFFDPSFSRSKEVACATCHLPHLQFTDGEPHPDLASSKSLDDVSDRGVIMNTMPLFALSEPQEFFWDGRAPTLEEQALGPIEDPREHHFSRLGVAKVLLERYSKRLRMFLDEEDATAMDLVAKIPFEHAYPEPFFDHASMPKSLAFAVYALQDLRIQAAFLGKEESPAAHMGRWIGSELEVLRPEWIQNWAKLSEAEKDAVSKVVGIFQVAVAAFERTILPEPTKFDRLVELYLDDQKSNLDAVVEEAEWVQEEWDGLKIFVGKGQCVACHSGPYFSNFGYHNNGSTQIQAEGFRVEHMGRALGLLRSEQGVKMDDPMLVGAFKTPSLRYLTQTSPYMHDGSLLTLDSVLEFYAQPNKKGFGHVAETVQQISLDAKEMKNLKAFLLTLSLPEKEDMPRDAEHQPNHFHHP